MVVGAHWANKVGPPRVMTGFARGPALIAFYLFLISRAPPLTDAPRERTDRRTDVSREGTSGPQGPYRGQPTSRFISLIGDRLTAADLRDSDRFTIRSFVAWGRGEGGGGGRGNRTASFVAFFIASGDRSPSRLINSPAP